MGRACSANGKKRNAYRILVEKPEIKRSHGIPKCKREDDFIIDLGDKMW
jgi:hypothetical protein